MEAQKEVWGNVKDMLDVPENNRFVRSMSSYPVSINLWNNLQRNLYQNFHKQRVYTVLYFDATENVVDYPIIYKNLKTHPLNVYTLILEKMGLMEICLPVGAVISERKRAFDISSFLYEWLEFFQYLPQEVVMDQEAASIVAFMRVFNKMDVKEYVRQAFAFLRGDTDRFKLVLIRLDKNHIVHTFSKIKINTEGSCSQLVSRSICRLVEETNFRHVCDVIGNLLILLSGEHRSEQVIGAENFLNKHIRMEVGPRFEAYPVSGIDFDVGFTENWFNEIYTTAGSLANGDYDVSINNPYLNGRLVQYLHRICEKILLWTAVLPAKRKSCKLSGTSAAIESYHGHLKSRLLLKETVSLDTGIEILEKFVKSSVEKKISGIYNSFFRVENRCRGA